ncbi:MAG: GNAT family N-acetyltransferase [Candidatus Hodarchaeota archaeon]
MEKQYEVRIIDSPEKWGVVSTSWNEILRKSNSKTIFLTWEWLHTWSEFFCTKDRLLFIIAIYQNEKLVGLAPWCIHFLWAPFSKIRRIEFLGSPEMGSDYLDVFAQKGKEEEVARCIYDYLFGEASRFWDTILLRDIPSDSLFLLYFMEQLRNDGKYASLNEGAFCPIVISPGSWNDFFQNLSPNRREQLRRHHRLLMKHGYIEHETLIQGPDSEHVLNRFISMYKSWWGKNKHHKFYNHLKSFVAKSAFHAWVQYDFLTIDGKDIASFLQFRYNGTLSMYLMAVDKTFNTKISIGNILIGLCLEKAMSDGISVYDFLKGTEKYKFHWSNAGRRSLVLQLYQRRIGVLESLFFETLKNAGKIILR